MSLADIIKASHELDILGYDIDSISESKIWTAESIRNMEHLEFCPCEGEELKHLIVWCLFSLTYSTFNAPTELIALGACHIPTPRTGDPILASLAVNKRYLNQNILKSLNKLVFDESNSMNLQVIERIRNEQLIIENDLDIKNQIFSFINIEKTAPKKDKEMNDLMIDDEILTPKFKAYTFSLCLCAFRSITKNAEVVKRSLIKTYTDRLKSLYKFEFNNNQNIISLMDDDSLVNIKMDLQEGSISTRVIISYCLKYLMSQNANTACIGILRYCVLTHTSMAGLQLLGMAMMACHTLNLQSPTILFKKIGKEQIAKSIIRLLRYFTLYLSRINRLQDAELKEQTNVRLTFKWAKLLDQQYYADISLKNNLHLGFQLASFNSPDMKSGQIIMAAFDNPILSTEMKRQIFSESKMIAHILINKISPENCLPEHLEMQEEMRELHGNFNEDGQFLIKSRKELTTVLHKKDNISSVRTLKSHQPTSIIIDNKSALGPNELDDDDFEGL